MFLHMLYMWYIYAYIAYFVRFCLLSIYSYLVDVVHVAACTTHRFAWLGGRGATWRSARTQSIEDEQHDDAPADDQAVPASPQNPPVAVAPRHIADMRTVMRKVGGPDYEEILRELDDHLGPGNHVFPSERCGGEARRLLLKRKASQMSAYFAYSLKSVHFCVHSLT